MNVRHGDPQYLGKLLVEVGLLWLALIGAAAGIGAAEVPSKYQGVWAYGSGGCELPRSESDLGGSLAYC